MTAHAIILNDPNVILNAVKDLLHKRFPPEVDLPLGPADGTAPQAEIETLRPDSSGLRVTCYLCHPLSLLGGSQISGFTVDEVDKKVFLSYVIKSPSSAC
jgi:hypothetical protein